MLQKVFLLSVVHSTSAKAIEASKTNQTKSLIADVEPANVELDKAARHLPLPELFAVITC